MQQNDYYNSGRELDSYWTSQIKSNQIYLPAQIQKNKYEQLLFTEKR